MMGTRDRQRDLFRADHRHVEFVGRDSFYGWLATEGRCCFSDDDFAEFYVLDNGRPSVPPSQLIVLLLLQGFDRVSDSEAVSRCSYDLRWKVALGLDDHEKLCAKSTMQMFRAKLLLHEKGRELLERSVRVCRQAGLLKSRRVGVAIDTTPIFGRGAVKDTYNLLGDGIVKLLRAVVTCYAAEGEVLTVDEVASRHDLTRYVSGTSLKGEAEVDWGSKEERRLFLESLVVDAKRAIQLARERVASCVGVSDVSEKAKSLVEAAITVLEQLLTQDVEEGADKRPQIRRGVAKDRMPSVHDPEVRHGRKSKMTRFDGHKGELVIDTESSVILEASVKPGNANDAAGSLQAIERAEETLQNAFGDSSDEVAIDSTLGDCAYGTARNLRSFEDAGRHLEAKQPRLHNGGRFTKEDFPLDEATGERVCPAGHRAPPRKRRRRWNGKQVKVNVYRWNAEICMACPLRQHCLRPPKGEDDPRPRGRSVSNHPEEALLARARARAKEPEFRKLYRQRTRAEHGVARLMQLGARQARYVGRAKTALQWLLAATVANLALVASRSSGSLERLWSLLTALSFPWSACAPSGAFTTDPTHSAVALRSTPSPVG